MSDNKKAPNETETILMALDQISQTIDVMTSVVGRLRSYLQEQDGAEQADAKTKDVKSGGKLQANRTLH